MLKKQKKAFSLLEVIIASGILTLTFLGVYKLIGENTKIISNSSNFLQANILEKNTEQCIENIGFNYFKIKNIRNYTFNLGVDGTKCNTGNTIITKLDNIEYLIKGEITNSGSTFIDWNIMITGDGISKINKKYNLLK